MEPVTLILTALAAGAGLALNGAASAAVTDAYHGLKALVRRKLAGRPDGELLLARHEEAPQVWHKPLAEELTAAGAAQDQGLVTAAQALLRLVDAAGSAAGKYQVVAHGSQDDTHPDTLSSRNNLALAYQAAGRLDEAIPLYERTLTDREQIMGPGHPSTLASRTNLANAYEAAGRLDEAIRLLERTLTDCERILGGTHPGTLESRNNLAAAYQKAGRLDEALALRERPPRAGPR